MTSIKMVETCGNTMLQLFFTSVIKIIELQSICNLLRALRRLQILQRYKTLPQNGFVMATM